MIGENGFFDSSVFTYYVVNSDNTDFGLEKKCSVQGWNVFSSPETKIRIFEKEDSGTVAVIGYCIDSHGELNADEIPEFLSLQSEAEFFVQLARLAGKYVILKAYKDGLYVYTDATASLPAFYSQKEGMTCVSSNEYFIKEITGAGEDGRISAILKKADGAKTLPGDMTHYDGVYALLPNTFYTSFENKAFRYNLYEPSVAPSSSEAAVRAAELIENVTKSIAQDYEIKCPLTGGYDSRVVFGVLGKLKYEPLEIYTMRHKNSPDADDIAIPARIASDYGINHHLLEDKSSPDEYIDFADKVFGKDFYSKRTLDIVATIKEHIGKGCILNGDIMGQIGKSSLHRSIPEIFMGPRYYRCKIHNTSAYALAEVKKWYRQIKKNAVENVCDSFSQEIRLGRWAADENSMYSLFGINVINCFNCHEIIRLFRAVPRKERKLSKLHKELIGIFDSKLLNYSFGAEKITLESLARKTDIGFYIATFAKYYIQVIKNIKG